MLYSHNGGTEKENVSRNRGLFFSEATWQTNIAMRTWLSVSLKGYFAICCTAVWGRASRVWPWKSGKWKVCRTKSWLHTDLILKPSGYSLGRDAEMQGFQCHSKLWKKKYISLILSFLFLLERKMPLATQLLQLVYVFSTFLPHFSERSS